MLSTPVSAVVATGHAHPRKLNATDKITLALNRFTFGIEPGDESAVKHMGLNRWFESQLSPQHIDDSAFEHRLDAYPALRMTQAARMQRYPEPAAVRRAAKSGFLPSDPDERIILKDQVALYQAGQVNKAVKTTPVSLTGTVATSTLAKPIPLPQNSEAMPQPEVQTILDMPPAARYQHVLAMDPEDLVALRKGAGEVRLIDGMTPLQGETVTALGGTNRMLTSEVHGARLLRDIYSERQVEAVMTDFWLNHFNVYERKNGQEPSLLPEYEQTVRAHALGRFEDLLVAVAQSPAMQMYLDNASSVGPDSPASMRAKRKPNGRQASAGINENYARELMELHTLGVNGGYTQHDVTEVAKVFTGWTLERPDEGGAFTFNENRHEPGQKVVLGQTIEGSGENEGIQVLHMLANSPATARFISTELAERFVSDAPPPALVDRMTKSFLASHGDIRTVLLTLFRSPEFFTTATVHAKLKTPLEYVVGAARVSGAEVTNPTPLAQALDRLGMPLYGAEPPTGYKWDEATWLSSSALVARMNFALMLSTNRMAGIRVDWSRLLLDTGPKSGLQRASCNAASDAEGQESALETLLLDGPASAQTHGVVLSQANGATTQPGAGQAAIHAALLSNGKTPEAASQTAAMAGLLLGSPEFERR